MDITTPAVAATQFTAYMAMLNLCISYTSWWQGLAVEQLGYPMTLLLDSVVGLFGLLLLPLMRPPRAAGDSAQRAARRCLSASREARHGRAGRPACLDRPQRGAHRHRHRRAAGRPRGDARPRRSRAGPRHARCRRSGTGCTSCRSRARASSAPTAIRAAAASCRRWRCRAACGRAAGSRFDAAAARRRRGDAPIDDRRRRRARARARDRSSSSPCATRSPTAPAWRSRRSTTSSTATCPRRARCRRSRRPRRADESFSRRIVPDDVLLFRYSALTFNGHRIHYDRRYVTEVEGYPA